MNIVEEDIRRGNYHRIYLLYGEEDYLKDYYGRKLCEALIPPDDSMNLNRFGGKEADPSVLISLSETMPFFAQYRLIAVKDSGLFKKGGDSLAEYCSQIPESTVFLFQEKEVDKRTRLYKAVKGAGAVLEFQHLKADMLTNWLLRRLQKNGKEIQRSAMDLLLERGGEDMYVLSNEVEKLIAYVGDREGITYSDVFDICTEQLENRVFRMIDAAAAGNPEKTFSLYRDLVFMREPSLRILALIASHFRRLLLVRDLRDQGYDRNTIAARTRLQQPALRGLIGQAERFDSRQIRRILSDCASADEAVKTGRMKDQTAVELLLAQISQTSKNAPA